MPVPPLLAFPNLIEPLIGPLTQVLFALHGVVPNFGWALVLLALLVRIFLWPFTSMQVRSMAEMQRVQPLVKQLQAKYKNDQQALQAATMALYKEHKVNPLAGCLPMLIPFPILIGLYWAITKQIDSFRSEHWLWIGSPISHRFPDILATSLAVPDVVLLVLYVISMYFTVRYGSPPSQDPQQAQQQKIMAIVSPAMIAFFGFKYRWASALYIYWLASNVFTVAQQFYMYRRYGLYGRPPTPPPPDPPAEPRAPVAKGQRSVKKAPPDSAASGDGKSGNRAKKRTRR